MQSQGLVRDFGSASPSTASSSSDNEQATHNNKPTQRKNHDGKLIDDASNANGNEQAKQKKADSNGDKSDGLATDTACGTPLYCAPEVKQEVKLWFFLLLSVTVLIVFIDTANVNVRNW